MEEEERLALIGGPYSAPEVQVGQEAECLLSGRVVVLGWSQGRIPWPYHHRRSLILCGDLERAVRVESSAAILYWFGVSRYTVMKWRRHLGVPFYNEGTVRLLRMWAHENLGPEQRAQGREARNRPENIARRRAAARPYGTLSQRPWLPEEDALLGTMADAQVARDLGRGAWSVGLRRQSLGIPVFNRPEGTEGRAGMVRADPAKVLARRLALGLTQEQAGQRMGCCSIAICQIETGRRARMRLVRLERLATALECDPSELLG